MKAKLLIALIAIFLIGFAQADTLDVTLTWTAPGDDGYSGIAHMYDLRYSINDSLPLVNDYFNCPRILGLPLPDTAGTPQTFNTMVEIESGNTIYFAIRTADEVWNWSGLSNIRSIYYEVVDITRPGVILDLEVIINR